MKKLLIALCVIGMLLASVNLASAGQKQRHRWQGVAIGLGAAVLGSALINNCDEYRSRERLRVYRPRYSCPPPCRDPYVRAYEEERERIRLKEHYRWEQEQRRRGRNDAREDYYGR